MNKEIKEILDFLDDDSRERPFGISNYDIKVLRDYITNLEKKYENAVADYEMEKAKNNIIVKLGDEYKSTIDDLQKHCLNQKTKIKELEQENKELKNELLSKPDNEITLTTQDGQELTIIQSKRIDMQEKLNKSLEEMYKKLNDYKSRIDKAIEYIKISMNNPQPFYEYIIGDENGKVQNLDKLLNILTGGDE